MLAVDPLALIVSILEQTGDIKNPWLAPHQLRYAETLKRLDTYDGNRGAALELGVTKTFQYILSEIVGFETVYGTVFREKADQPVAREVFSDRCEQECDVNVPHGEF